MHSYNPCCALVSASTTRRPHLAPGKAHPKSRSQHTAALRKGKGKKKYQEEEKRNEGIKEEISVRSVTSSCQHHLVFTLAVAGLSNTAAHHRPKWFDTAAHLEPPWCNTTASH
jgi:hypothetical protein